MREQFTQPPGALSGMPCQNGVIEGVSTVHDIKRLTSNIKRSLSNYNAF